ncbi:MAG: RluA family pseudouridine synthase [Isosphaeraceae bacterium]
MSANLPLEILFEDNHCFAVNKPAGMLSQGDITGDPSLVDRAAEYLKVAYNKPGNVFVGLVHRLDRPVSGVVLLARTSKAAERLSGQFREGRVRKVYRAIVEGQWPEDAGVWTDRIGKDRFANRSRTVDPVEYGKEATLAYRVISRTPTTTTFELQPRTGRGHQIRVQLADRGLPILGDRKYGSKRLVRALDGGHRIALHASALEFRHPTLGEVIGLTATEPADWPLRSC